LVDSSVTFLLVRVIHGNGGGNSDPRNFLLVPEIDEKSDGPLLPDRAYLILIQ